MVIYLRMNIIDIMKQKIKCKILRAVIVSGMAYFSLINNGMTVEIDKKN